VTPFDPREPPIAGVGTKRDFHAPVRRLLAALLLFAVPGCADGSAPMTRTWDGGMYVDGDVLCGLASEPCCGAGFCEEGLACVAGTCLSSTCGGEGMACCDMGSPCGPGLSCNGGLCAPGGAVDCGNLGGGCCETAPACGGGLSCIAGLCREAGGGDCGAVTEACCAGDVCDSGNVCVDGTCREEVPIPMCVPLGSTCSTTSDCCDGTCSGGTCSDEPPPPPPSDPPPSSGSCSAFSCYDCTLQENCGWCDGRCVTVDFDPDRPPCADFSWTIIECF